MMGAVRQFTAPQSLTRGMSGLRPGCTSPEAPGCLAGPFLPLAAARRSTETPSFVCAARTGGRISHKDRPTLGDQLAERSIGGEEEPASRGYRLTTGGNRMNNGTNFLDRTEAFQPRANGHLPHALSITPTSTDELAMRSYVTTNLTGSWSIGNKDRAGAGAPGRWRGPARPGHRPPSYYVVAMSGGLTGSTTRLGQQGPETLGISATEPGVTNCYQTSKRVTERVLTPTNSRVFRTINSLSRES